MDYSAGKSPRRELQLQGPRPTPLRIHKDSHKIKKPPVVPQPSQPPHGNHHHHHHQTPPPHYPQPRQPVIIYTVSPKVIHTNPSDFMDLVQRLTGLSPSSPSPPSNSHNDDMMMNPPREDHVMTMKRSSSSSSTHDDHEDVAAQGMDMDVMRPKSSLFPGILSPGPASLAPIPSNFFSPPADSFFHDLSPVLHGNRNFIEGSYMPSPSNFFSPNTSSIDLFNNFSDL